MGAHDDQVDLVRAGVVDDLVEIHADPHLGAEGDASILCRLGQTIQGDGASPVSTSANFCGSKCIE